MSILTLGGGHGSLRGPLDIDFDGGLPRTTKPLDDDLNCGRKTTGDYEVPSISILTLGELGDPLDVGFNVGRGTTGY